MNGVNRGLHGAWRCSGAVLLLLLGACAVLQEPQQQHLQSTDISVRECAEWFRDIDERIDGAGVRDAEGWRVPGFPYLRSSRFLAAFRQEVVDNPVTLPVWLEQMRNADLQARAAELRNLESRTADTAIGTARRCGALLMRSDRADSAAVGVLPSRVRVPDAYVEWQRVAGLYALARIPFAGGVARWHEEARGMFAQSRAATSKAHSVERYGPGSAQRYARAEVAALLARAAGRPLGLARLSEIERDRLFATYAPVFEVETTGSYDHPGALSWTGDDLPTVDTQKPVAYRRLAHTRYNGRTLVQLVYTIWFRERPPDHEFDILSGKLDGLVWRVTLAPDGEPVLFDTMHPCGCFHMFLPPPAAVALPAPEPGDEWVFVPARLPRLAENQRVRLRLATRSHYLVDAGPVVADGRAPRVYAMADERELRSLPLPDGSFRSAYGPDGLVPGTDRSERLFFWPMGIPSAGAMRQWGNHATAFLGRRHFDDADLIEKRFRLELN